jgi:hypothetical protein
MQRAQAWPNYTGLGRDSKIRTGARPPAAGTTEDKRVSRDNEPIRGQWYENVEEDETFRVLSVDEDSELIEIEYLDGDIEEIDVETWHEMDLELTDEPEGWSDTDDEDDDLDEEEEEEEEDEDDDEDDDWDEDEDDDWDDEDDR